MGYHTERVMDQLTIHIAGEFNYGAREKFRESYVNEPADSHYVIDFSDATGLDSSALGMMLMLRTHAKHRADDITITNCNQTIRKLLELAQFHKLFRME